MSRVDDGIGFEPAVVGRVSADASAAAANVVAAQNGEPGAWEALVREWARRVYAAANSRLRNADAAEEVTQSVMVTVYEHISTGRYQETGQFESWLFRIAMNRVRDVVRKASRRRERQLTHDAGGTPGSSPRSDTPDIAGLRDAIATLPEADQEIISLRHHGGLGFQSIADSLGQPLGTVLARHHRALKKLQQHMSQSADGGEER